MTAAAADDSLAVTFGTDDADGMVEGHQWDLALGDNTLQITVSDGTVSRVYTVTVRKVDADVLSDDATLSVDGAAGHQVALAVGPNRVRVAVDATDGRGRAEYTLHDRPLGQSVRPDALARPRHDPREPFGCAVVRPIDRLDELAPVGHPRRFQPQQREASTRQGQ